MTDSTPPSHDKYPKYTCHFADVYLAELDYIKERRKKMELPGEEAINSELKRVCDNQEQIDSVAQEISRTSVVQIVIAGFSWIAHLFSGITDIQKKQRSNIQPSVKMNLVGLALSGGGVRSATFNLGLLQSLSRNKVLRYCDYLSTVSGGGYIGSCLSSLLANTPKEEASTDPDQFPLRNRHDGEKEQDEVNYLRKTKNYLGFGRGIFNIETWQVMGTILSGLMLMITIPLAVILLTVLGLWWVQLGLQQVQLLERVQLLQWVQLPPSLDDWQYTLIVAAIIAAVVGVVGFLWIMIIRLRQVSAFWEWVMIFIIPLMVLFLTSLLLFLTLDQSLYFFYFEYLQIAKYNNLSDFIILLVNLLIAGILLLTVLFLILIWGTVKNLYQILRFRQFSELFSPYNKPTVVISSTLGIVLVLLFYLLKDDPIILLLGILLIIASILIMREGFYYKIARSDSMIKASIAFVKLILILSILLILVEKIFSLNTSKLFEFNETLIGILLMLPLVVLLRNMYKRISQMSQTQYYYSYKLRSRHDKRMGWRLAVLSLLITVILLGSFIYSLANELSFQETNIVFVVVIALVSIGSILVVMVGRFLNLYQKAQEKLTSIVVSIALVILFSALFALLLAGSKQVERYYQGFIINNAISHYDYLSIFKGNQNNITQQQEIEAKPETSPLNYFRKPDKGSADWENVLNKLDEVINTLPDAYPKTINIPEKFQEIVKGITHYRHMPSKDQEEEIKKWLDDEQRQKDQQDCIRFTVTQKGYQGYDVVKKIYCHPLVKGEEFKNRLGNALKDALNAKNTITIIVLSVSGILLIIGLITNINYNSLHYFYRDHLSNTYLIKRVNQPTGENTIEPNDSLLLRELHKYYNSPYHLLNTTLNIPSSIEPSLSGRGADFFIFSKYYCGAQSTGYRRTDCYESGNTKLATAMAISGAAASPEMGSSTSPGMAFLMVLLNIRLNLWMPNPNLTQYPKIIIWPYYLFKELFHKSTEDNALLNLSDGGHHENLGIYPLLKRRCRIIIASDAGADPYYQMEDFANLQRKARIDLGINININLEKLRPNPENHKYSETYFVKGNIYYPNGEEGTLFYLKTTMTGKEPEDLLAYRRKNPQFPDETTADQFFNEDQFESYRKLGEFIGEELCGSMTGSEIQKEIGKIFGTGTNNSPSSIS